MAPCAAGAAAPATAFFTAGENSGPTSGRHECEGQLLPGRHSLSSRLFFGRHQAEQAGNDSVRPGPTKADIWPTCAESLQTKALLTVPAASKEALWGWRRPLLVCMRAQGAASHPSQLDGCGKDVTCIRRASKDRRFLMTIVT